MQPPPIPDDEETRLAALAQAQVLDTPPEVAFDNLAKLAAAICQVPIALVTFVDRHRQWFKAKVGTLVEETPREMSFCGHAVAADQTLVVRDARQDVRFADNPLVVDEPRIVFYAGVPLRAKDGAALGTLCVMDRTPRQLTAAQMQALDMLARQATTELRLRRELARVHAARATTVSEARAPALLAPGQVVGGRYRIERAIGQGAMSIVYAAADLRAGARVALKLLRRELVQSDASVERFAREARLVMSLRDPHVAAVLDAGNTDDDVPFLVLELLEGDDLAVVLDRSGRLPVPEAVDLLRQACQGVAAAHRAGIVHRDLKPGNLFLTGGRPPAVKVVDFGVAKAMAVEGSDRRVAPALTEAKTIVGSPLYMAPEQMFGAPDIDARADVWSLGVVLHEALAGAPPFQGESLNEVCTAVILRPPPGLAQARPEVPPALAAVVERCLSKERDGRYPDAAALGRALDDVTIRAT